MSQCSLVVIVTTVPGLPFLMALMAPLPAGIILLPGLEDTSFLGESARPSIFGITSILSILHPGRDDSSLYFIEVAEVVSDGVANRCEEGRSLCIVVEQLVPPVVGKPPC